MYYNTSKLNYPNVCSAGTLLPYLCTLCTHYLDKWKNEKRHVKVRNEGENKIPTKVDSSSKTEGRKNLKSIIMMIGFLPTPCGRVFKNCISYGDPGNWVTKNALKLKTTDRRVCACGTVKGRGM